MAADREERFPLVESAPSFTAECDCKTAYGRVFAQAAARVDIMKATDHIAGGCKEMEDSRSPVIERRPAACPLLLRLLVGPARFVGDAVKYVALHARDLAEETEKDLDGR
jgi:hypothetical protein